jgi:ketoreductase RED2
MRSQTVELKGKVAIVTGSSSGIGEAVARRLADLGASVVVNSATSVESGTRLAESLPTQAIYVQADISDHDSCEGLVGQAVERLGRLDILVNNAGWTAVVPHDDLDALTDEIFLRTFDVNVFGTWRVTKAAVRYLRDSDDGNVVTITSLAGVRPIGSSIAYAMSKAALNHMTRLLAKSHGPVRFNAVAPGLVETPWTADWAAQHHLVRGAAPLHRSSLPEDQVEAVLACIRSRYMTGEVLLVDGGLSLVS